MHTCASGVPLVITTDTRQVAAVCVPTTTTSYPMRQGDPNTFPCTTGDYLAMSEAGVKCIPSGSAATTTTPPVAGGSLEELSARLATLRGQYTTLATQATTTPAQVPTLLPQIQSVNQQIAAVLDQMITQAQHAQQSPNSEAYRDELTATLARIQMDYNGLKTNTDALQTLKRIRAFQDTSWQPTLALYIALFLVAGALLILVVFLRRQTNVSTPTPMMSAPATPSLT